MKVSHTKITTEVVMSCYPEAVQDETCEMETMAEAAC